MSIVAASKGTRASAPTTVGVYARRLGYRIRVLSRVQYYDAVDIGMSLASGYPVRCVYAIATRAKGQCRTRCGTTDIIIITGVELHRRTPAHLWTSLAHHKTGCHSPCLRPMLCLRSRTLRQQPGPVRKWRRHISVQAGKSRNYVELGTRHARQATRPCCFCCCNCVPRPKIRPRQQGRNARAPGERVVPRPLSASRLSLPRVVL